jgi:hypothetical protein
MKRIFILLIMNIISLWCLHAQPCFNPTITSPRLNVFSQNSILFCDNDDIEILSTQVFDSYQWYKQLWWSGQGPNPNPWLAIQGANAQNYSINGTDDMLYYFKVITTLDTCTEESPAILADGYAFGLPYIIANFQPGTFVSLGNGEYNVCDGASVILENGFDQVYGLHTWYKCVPADIPPVLEDTCIISGETGDTYTATSSGFYGFWSCTEYCPNICLFLGLPSFIKLNFGDWSFCATGVNEPINSNKLSLYPNPATQLLFLQKVDNISNSNVMIIDINGKVVLNHENFDLNVPIDISHLTTGSYSIISTTKSGKIFRNKFIKKAE